MVEKQREEKKLASLEATKELAEEARLAEIRKEAQQKEDKQEKDRVSEEMRETLRKENGELEQVQENERRQAPEQNSADTDEERERNKKCHEHYDHVRKEMEKTCEGEKDNRTETQALMLVSSSDYVPTEIKNKEQLEKWLKKKIGNLLYKVGSWIWSNKDDFKSFTVTFQADEMGEEAFYAIQSHEFNVQPNSKTNAKGLLLCPNIQDSRHEMSFTKPQKVPGVLRIVERTKTQPATTKSNTATYAYTREAQMKMQHKLAKEEIYCEIKAFLRPEGLHYFVVLPYKPFSDEWTRTARKIMVVEGDKGILGLKVTAKGCTESFVICDCHYSSDVCRNQGQCINSAPYETLVRLFHLPYQTGRSPSTPKKMITRLQLENLANLLKPQGVRVTEGPMKKFDTPGSITWFLLGANTKEKFASNEVWKSLYKVFKDYGLQLQFTYPDDKNPHPEECINCGLLHPTSGCSARPYKGKLCRIAIGGVERCTKRSCSGSHFGCEYNHGWRHLQAERPSDNTVQNRIKPHKVKQGPEEIVELNADCGEEARCTGLTAFKDVLSNKEITYLAGKVPIEDAHKQIQLFQGQKHLIEVLGGDKHALLSVQPNSPSAEGDNVPSVCEQIAQEVMGKHITPERLPDLMWGLIKEAVDPKLAEIHNKLTRKSKQRLKYKMTTDTYDLDVLAIVLGLLGVNLIMLVVRANKMTIEVIGHENNTKAVAALAAYQKEPMNDPTLSLLRIMDKETKDVIEGPFQTTHPLFEKVLASAEQRKVIENYIPNKTYHTHRPNITHQTLNITSHPHRRIIKTKKNGDRGSHKRNQRRPLGYRKDNLRPKLPEMTSYTRSLGKSWEAPRINRRPRGCCSKNWLRTKTHRSRLGLRRNCTSRRSQCWKGKRRNKSRSPSGGKKYTKSKAEQKTMNKNRTDQREGYDFPLDPIPIKNTVQSTEVMSHNSLEGPPITGRTGEPKELIKFYVYHNRTQGKRGHKRNSQYIKERMGCSTKSTIPLSLNLTDILIKCTTGNSNNSTEHSPPTKALVSLGIYPGAYDHRDLSQNESSLYRTPTDIFPGSKTYFVLGSPENESWRIHHPSDKHKVVGREVGQYQDIDNPSDNPTRPKILTNNRTNRTNRTNNHPEIVEGIRTIQVLVLSRRGTTRVEEITTGTPKKYNLKKWGLPNSENLTLFLNGKPISPEGLWTLPPDENSTPLISWLLKRRAGGEQTEPHQGDKDHNGPGKTKYKGPKTGRKVTEGLTIPDKTPRPKGGARGLKTTPAHDPKY